MNNSYKTFYTDAEVEVSLDEWSEQEIVDHMTDLGYTITKTPDDVHQLNKLADAKQYNFGNFDKIFADYVYNTIGRIL
jgi:hypothetical protein